MAEEEGKKQGDLLAEEFPAEQLKRHPAKGLTYVPIPEVIARLNRVLGYGHWHTEIIKLWTAGNVVSDTGDYPKWVMAHIRLTGTVDGVEFSYDGVGGQEVQLLRNNSGPVDIGDNYKGAVSDATKKAAQSLGVALSLAREDDAMAYEQSLKDADQPKAPPQALDRIRKAVAGLDDEVRADFVRWWANVTGDGERGKKLDSGQVTVREASQAIEYLAPYVKDEQTGGSETEPTPSS